MPILLGRLRCKDPGFQTWSFVDPSQLLARMTDIRLVISLIQYSSTFHSSGVFLLVQLKLDWKTCCSLSHGAKRHLISFRFVP